MPKKPESATGVVRVPASSGKVMSDCGSVLVSHPPEQQSAVGAGQYAEHNLARVCPARDAGCACWTASRVWREVQAETAVRGRGRVGNVVVDHAHSTAFSQNRCPSVPPRELLEDADDIRRRCAQTARTRPLVASRTPGSVRPRLGQRGNGMEIGASASRSSRDARPCDRRASTAGVVSVDSDEGLQKTLIRKNPSQLCHARPSNPVLATIARDAGTWSGDQPTARPGAAFARESIRTRAATGLMVQGPEPPRLRSAHSTATSSSTSRILVRQSLHRGTGKRRRSGGSLRYAPSTGRKRSALQ